MVKKEGFKETDSKLARFETYNREVSAKMPDLGRSVAVGLFQTPYAPPPAGSQYVRQFDLKWGYDWRKTGNMQVTIANDAQKNGRFYSGYVVQKATQAAVHRGRWWTAEEKVLPFVEKWNNNMAQHAAGFWDK